MKNNINTRDKLQLFTWSGCAVFSDRSTKKTTIMATHPINLAIRFLLELSTLSAIGIWGWKQSDSWPKFILAFGLPIVLMTIWGTFAVPDDPSRSGSAPVVTPGIIRLTIELFFFAAGVWALYDMESTNLSLIMAIVVVVHYAVSYERVQWLFQH
jgi:hypothetical protein